MEPDLIETRSCLVGFCLICVAFLLTIIGIVSFIRWIF